MVQVQTEKVEEILNQLTDDFGPLGFEIYRFKIGWYNLHVQPSFKFTCNEDTVAFLILSTPRMFENAFIPFLQDKHDKISGLRDPIDECMSFYLSKIPELFPSYSVNIVHDFELHPNRRPKVILQSAAHAAGAAFFYHPRSVYLNYTKERQKMNGVCIHPCYGGWFALRAVAIFENLLCPDLPCILPRNCISNGDQSKLLELYNFSWTDWKYRDIIKAKEKYSDLQIKYFSAPPGDRFKVIDEILEKCIEIK